MHVLATAGHVDHGKSTLVRALTGIEPDRWEAERRRGLTIDLGYAWTTLPDGRTVAFVDVPGHRRFIGNMLAGVGPVPGVVFVVAADSGWSAQSSEHLRAVEAFGIDRGLLVVTRADLADPTPALLEAQERLAATGLAGCEAVAVSAVTGTGLQELRAGLERLCATLPAPEGSSRVRLWVDRSFTISGAGTVVTGTLGAGSIAVGDELEIEGRRVRVRGLQSLGQPVSRVEGVARVAVNLRGIAADDIHRGQALTTPGAWRPTTLLDARFVADPDTRPELPSRLTLHIGTAAPIVHTRPLGDGAVRIALPTPLPLVAGDRAILRDPGDADGEGIAGVLVLDADPDPAPPRRRGPTRCRTRRARRRCTGSSDRSAIARRHAGRARPRPRDRPDDTAQRTRGGTVRGWAARDDGAALRRVARRGHAVGLLGAGLAGGRRGTTAGRAARPVCALRGSPRRVRPARSPTRRAPGAECGARRDSGPGPRSLRET